LHRAVVRVQAAWRARQARLELMTRKRRAAADMDLLGEGMDALGVHEGGQTGK
jgi:hypothetical protein